jgi:hypothetical protein
MLATMATGGTVLQRRPAGFDPAAFARRLQRIGWGVAIVAIVMFLLRFGAERVPRGMDTVPDMPPGSLCFVDRSASSVQVGAHVFLEVPELGLVLSRVTAVDAATVTFRHPNANSGWPDSQGLGPLPRSCVRSTVLTTFAAGGR